MKRHDVILNREGGDSPSTGYKQDAMADPPFPILFLAPDGRTEAIFASGLLNRLRDEIEGARFTVVAGSQEAALFREAPELDELIVAERRRGLGASFGLWRRLRARNWGLALDAGGGRMVDALKARRRARFRASAVEPAHRVVEAARLLKLEEDPPAPHLDISEETRARAQELVAVDGPVLAMAPAAPWVGAAWPVERYARAAAQLLGDDGPLAGGRLLIVGTPEDARSAEALRRSAPSGRWIDLSHETDPLVVAACIERAQLFVGGAVWLTHLAAAAGAPTLGLYGPTDEAIEGVWGKHARTVRGPRGFEAIRAADPRLDQSICHMMDLSVDTVVEAALELLDKTRPAGRSKRNG
jgi:ADP-heptose:LPS heptosyltransferase